MLISTWKLGFDTESSLKQRTTIVEMNDRDRKQDDLLHDATMKRHISLVTIAIMFALTASSVAFARRVRPVAPGKWNGKHVNLTVTQTGFEFEFDCATGSAKGPTVIDRHGKFSLMGNFVGQPGSPSVPRESHPAEYSGLVKGTLMTLEVRLADSKQLVGTYQLVFGQHQRLDKCPVSPPGGYQSRANNQAAGITTGSIR